MKEVMLEDFIRFASDVYFPENKRLYPEIRKTNKRNTPVNGFYPESILKEKHGWTRVKYTDPDPTGFFAALYAPTNEAEDKSKPIRTGIIAFRGSDDIYDFLHHDLRLANNKWPQAFDSAKNFYTKIKKDYGQIKKLYFTGHSLGGALAQLVAIEVNKKDYFCDQRPAVCFNAPQVGQIIKSFPKPNLDKNSIDSHIDKIRNKLQSSPQKFNDDAYDAIKYQAKTANVVIAPSAFYFAAAFNIGKSGMKEYHSWHKDINKWVGELFPIFKEVYENMGYAKNMQDCVKYGQPAFNCVYHLITQKPDKTDLNRRNFAKNYDAMVNDTNYNFIFNFNSYYDLVHACGSPIGSQCVIDIDKPKYAEKWGATKLDKQMRMQAELRTFVTLQPEYFQHKSNVISLASCKVDLQKDILGKIKAPQANLFPLLHKYLNYKLEDHWSHEFVYYVGTQHSIVNLAAALLEEKELIKTTFERKNVAKKNMRDFQQNNPFETFDGKFQEKIAGMIEGAELYSEEYCARRWV